MNPPVARRFWSGSGETMARFIEAGDLTLDPLDVGQDHAAFFPSPLFHRPYRFQARSGLLI